MEIKDRIILARESAGITVSELARRIGISPQAVQKWENGTSAPRLKKLKNIADILECSHEWLATGEGSFKGGNSTPEDEQKASQEILNLIDQLDGERKKDAVEILEGMAKQQKILNKYGF